MDIVKQRIKRAVDSLNEAKILANEGYWNATVNRLYYACFYIVNALLHKHDLHSTKHSGVRSLFNQHFVKTGEIPIQNATILNELFDMRNDVDYDDYFNADQSQVETLIPEVKNFIKIVEEKCK